MQGEKKRKRHYHNGMLNGKTWIIVSLCVLIIAGVVFGALFSDKHMTTTDIIALATGIGGVIGGLSWVYTRPGQGSATDPAKTDEQEKKDNDKSNTEGGGKNDV